MSLVIDPPQGSSISAPDVPQAIEGDKFAVPPMPGAFVERRRLQHVLSRAPMVPLTLVVGPIGVGKTTLLASFAHSRPRGATAWCTLDARDADPHTFGTSVLRAVLAARASVDIDQLAGVRASSPDPLDQALDLAVNGPELVLVLDDVEHIVTRGGRAALKRLIQTTPHGLSTVLVTRRDLDLHQTFRGIRPETLRAGELAFTAPEATAFFLGCDVTASDDDIATLTAWTEGSAAALKLAAVHMKDAEMREPLLNEARNRDRSVIDYLFSGALDRQPNDLRQFILRTSVVDVVGTNLAEALVEDERAPELLDQVVRDQQFLAPIGAVDGWYRHHSMIRDLLRATLEHELPQEAARLHSRASRWFEAAGCPDDAICHAALAHDWDPVARMVIDAWTTATLERKAVPVRVTAYPIPGDVGEHDPMCALASAIQCLERGEHAEASAQLSIARVRPEDPDEAVSSRVKLVTNLIRAAIACEQADNVADIVEAAGELETCAPFVCDSLDERVNLTKFVTHARAKALLRDGDLQTTRELLEGLVSTADESEQPRDVTATMLLALTDALGGRLRNAAMLCDELGEAPADTAPAHARGVRALTLAICSYHADDLPSSRTLLAEARRELRGGVCRDVIAPALAARIALSSGDRDGARRHLAAVATCRTALLDVLDDALGLPDLAAAAGTARNDKVTRPGRRHPYVVARAHVKRAVERAAMSDYREAQAECEVVFALVDRYGYRRVFVDCGLPVHDVLVDYVTGVRPHRMLATQLLEREGVDSGAANGHFVEHLTERELRVLRHLPTMMSNSEIAAEMHFSVNTVKTHLKSIYRKLDVTRRRQAVERARALSLI